jgi:hypothetical protein
MPSLRVGYFFVLALFTAHFIIFDIYDFKPLLLFGNIRKMSLSTVFQHFRACKRIDQIAREKLRILENGGHGQGFGIQYRLGEV